jgi:hypothetical protein
MLHLPLNRSLACAKSSSDRFVAEFSYTPEQEDLPASGSEFEQRLLHDVNTLLETDDDVGLFVYAGSSQFVRGYSGMLPGA